ncbi:MAG: hypothetical protein EOP51_07730 [Sphingobacteriales bacterium]|nr:MAG: hypothetical protein EOP51_07730 [Sphingobacteriales bacterium]
MTDYLAILSVIMLMLSWALGFNPYQVILNNEKSTLTVRKVNFFDSEQTNELYITNLKSQFTYTNSSKKYVFKLLDKGKVIVVIEEGKHGWLKSVLEEIHTSIQQQQ